LLEEVAKALQQGVITARGAARKIRSISSSYLWRDPPIRRAPVKRRPTREVPGRVVRAYWREHPEMNNDEIGLHFDIDGARVSEFATGKRK
jgi:hypothetical protein